MTAKEIINNMIAFHNNQKLDWEKLSYQGQNSKNEIVVWVEQSIKELSELLEVFKKEEN